MWGQDVSIILFVLLRLLRGTELNRAREVGILRDPRVRVVRPGRDLVDSCRSSCGQLPPESSSSLFDLTPGVRGAAMILARQPRQSLLARG
jgi:hypothetical protein